MLLLLLACTAIDDETDLPAEEPGITDLSVERAEIPTVVWVRWRTAEPSMGLVRATFGADVIVVEEAAPATEHAVLVAGVPENTMVQVEVRSAEALPATAEITTGDLPEWVPDVAYAADVPEQSAGGFTVASVIDLDGGGGVVALDHVGRPVWAHTRIDDKAGAVTRARLSLDGNAFLYASPSGGAEDAGAIIRVPIDGSAVTSVPTLGTHTDFVELPTGGYASLGWELRELDGRTITGDTIVEVSPDGVTRVVWSAFDNFSPDPSVEYPHNYPGDPDAEDWTHINGIAYDAVEDDYYVTMTWNDGIARVDRGTGDLVWWLADEGSDFEKVGDWRLVLQPHSVQRIPDGLLVFNRGDPADPETCSQATEILIDEARGTAQRVDGYASERCLLVVFLGSALQLPGGNMLVSWTSAGQIDEVTPDGALAWRVNTNVGSGFGFAEWVPTLGDGVP